MKLRYIYGFLDTLCPFDTQCEWDNSGFLIGDFDAEVKKVGTALDLTAETLEKAKEESVDLIITHHPVIFRPVKALLKGDIAYEAARSGIPVISCHTSYDACEGGVNDVLAELFGLTEVESFGDSDAPYLARAGMIRETSPVDLAKKAATLLNTTVRLADAGKNIKYVGLCGGSGGDILQSAIEKGCDAFISGDMSHHHFLLARERDITIIAAGHFETENIAMEVLRKKLSQEFPAVSFIDLMQENPVKFIS